MSEMEKQRALVKEKTERATELLHANNREVERRRALLRVLKEVRKETKEHEIFLLADEAVKADRRAGRNTGG